MTWPHHAQHSNSAQNDDESDVEVLDLFGRKHVNRVDNADGIYLLQNDTETVHTFFRTPGMESADALRQFLAARLPEELVTDEYGCIVPIAEISGDHLPKLQAQLWLSENDKSGELLPSFSNGYTENQVRIPAPQRRSNTTRPPPQKPSAKEDLLRIACHVTFIAELLQGRPNPPKPMHETDCFSEPYLHMLRHRQRCLRIVHLSVTIKRLTALTTNHHHGAAHPLGNRHSCERHIYQVRPRPSLSTQRRKVC